MTTVAFKEGLPNLAALASIEQGASWQMGGTRAIDDAPYTTFVTTHGEPRSKEILRVARLTHAQGYVAEGLATSDAIIRGGVLRKEIDKWSHLSKATCYLAQNGTEPYDAATAKTIPVDHVEELPTFHLFADRGGVGVFGDLEELVVSGSGKVMELGALSKSKEAHETRRSQGVATVIRALLRDTLRLSEGDLQSTIYCSMVEESRQGLAKSISAANLTPVGSPVVLEPTRYRPATTLVPIIINPQEFVPNIFAAHTGALRRGDTKGTIAYLKSLIFFTEGLTPDEVGEEILEYRTAMVGQINASQGKEIK